MTDAQKRLLKAINEAGSVVLQNRGGGLHGLAAGEWLPYLPDTYLRTIGDGLIEFTEPRRLVLTERGKVALRVARI